jgi:hypothetical protein
MFFERLGMLFFSKIRPPFFFIWVSLPLLFTGMYILQKRLEIFELNEQYESTLLKAYKVLDTRTKKEEFLARYFQSEPYFLDQYIESMVLLQNEIDWLLSYKNHPALSENKLVESRLSYLTKGKNRISFLEEATRKSNVYKETEEKMKKPVEMDAEDIKKFLSLIENTPIADHQPHPKSPQMIITEFCLKKKKSPFDQEIFEVKTSLLKREFIKA